MFNTQLFAIWQTASIIFYTTSTEDANLTVLSSTTDKINRISNHFWDRWRHEYIVNLHETTNMKTKYKKRERYPGTFGELPLTLVLPSRESEIRGVKV